MSRILSSGLLGAGEIVLFPNGARFDANDVFVGSGTIDSIEFAHSGLGALTGVVNIYDAVTAATQGIVRGGTGTTESYRVIAANAVATNGALGDPVSLAAPNAQVTGMRPMMLAGYVNLPAAEPGFVWPLNLVCAAGMVVHVNLLAADPWNITINFTPWVSGGARRRRAYLPGSTSKTLPLVQAL